MLSLSLSLSLSPLLSMCRFSLQWPSLSLTQDCESLSLSRVRVHMVKRGHHYQLKLWQHIQEPSPRVVMLWALIRPEGGKHGVIDFQPQAHPLSKWQAFERWQIRVQSDTLAKHILSTMYSRWESVLLANNIIRVILGIRGPISIEKYSTIKGNSHIDFPWPDSIDLDSVVKFPLTWAPFTWSMALDAYHIDSVNTCYD